MKLKIILILLFLLTSCNNINQICFQQDCFEVELAKTSEEKKQGLMYRDYLEENKGMLFIYQKEEIYSYWMKNTLIPLDIIWINKDKEIVFIKKNAQPCKQEKCPLIKPDKKARYVLELNANMSEKINLKTGDKLTFNLKNELPLG